MLDCSHHLTVLDPMKIEPNKIDRLAMLCHLYWNFIWQAREKTELREKDKNTLRVFCLVWAEEFNCKPCCTCPLYGVLWCNNKIYDKGWTLKQAVRVFGRTSIPINEARGILEEKMGLPLDIVQILLKEIQDHEEKKEKPSVKNESE